MPDRCRSCKEPIIWARTAKGKNMPVDAEPAATEGNVILNWVEGGPPEAIVLEREKAARMREYAEAGTIDPLHTAHHYTCPYADQWRKS